MRISIIGGTGALGSGLALRCAMGGHEVLIGTRDPNRGVESIADIKVRLGKDGASASLQTMSNLEAAEAGEIVILAVRFPNQRETLELIRPAVQGKILIDTTVPLVPPKVMRVQLPAQGSAAQIAQKILGDGVRVVSAFQSVAAHHLASMGDVPCDVLVSGDDREAREAVIALARDIGLQAFHAGPLCNAAAAEALTSVLIFLNKEYHTQSGIRLTGIGDGGVREADNP